MFCPNCRAEYREGFTRCSDCNVELVNVLPPPSANASEPREDERPDLARPAHFLVWFLPMASFYIVTLLVMVVPSIAKSFLFLGVVLILITTNNFGLLWMLYQSIRYERRVGKYVLLSFVPFMFIWYSLVRLPLRKEFQGTSPFVR